MLMDNDNTLHGFIPEALFNNGTIYGSNGVPICLGKVDSAVIVSSQGIDTKGFATCTSFNNAFGTYTIDIWDCKYTDCIGVLELLIEFCDASGFRITTIRHSLEQTFNRILVVVQKAIT